jgi:hypothetical protein
MPRWQAGDADHPFRRYTFRFEHFPRTSVPQPYEVTTIRATTAGGAYKAAIMASGRLRGLRDNPVVYTVELVTVEDEWNDSFDNDFDAPLDYWEVS